MTYKSWRVILWLQAAMCGCGLIMSLIFIPYSRTLDAPTFRETSVSQMIGHFNPSHIFKLMIYPNVLFTVSPTHSPKNAPLTVRLPQDLACGLLSWSQYTLLSAPRHIITTRFHLSSPIISGLFYLSPAAGFLVGTLVGGRASDRTVRAWLAVIATKYCVQYCFAAAASGASVPMIDAIGVGATSTVSKLLAFLDWSCGEKTKRLS